MTTPTSIEPLLLRPHEAAQVLGVSRTELFRLLRRGELHSVLLGQRQRRIPADELRAFVERLREALEAATP